MFKIKRWPRLKAISKSLKKGSGIGAACEAAGMSRFTLLKWRKEDPKINRLIETHLDGQIGTVEDALLKSAVGFTYDEITQEVMKTMEGTETKKVVKKVTKHVTPNATSAMFYLMNRAPKRWADKRALVNNIVATVNNSGRDKLKDIPTALLKRMLEYANNGHGESPKESGSHNGNGSD